MKLNKAALAQAIADRVGLNKKDAEAMVDAFVDVTTSTLQKDGSVTIAGFGTFSAKQRAGRVGVNPQDPSKKMDIPPVTVAKFKAGSGLKKALKDGLAAPVVEEAAPEMPAAEEPAQEMPAAPPAPAAPEPDAPAAPYTPPQQY